MEVLKSYPAVVVQQRHELAELIGFETRNKYVVQTEQGVPLGFAAESQKGVIGFLLRQVLGHWRRFEIYFFDQNRQMTLKAVHPFRFFFQRLDVFSAEGRRIGALQRRWSIFSKRFDVERAGGEIWATVKSPIWRIWTFEFQRHGRSVAKIEKKWSGLVSEAFTDKDKFRVQFTEQLNGEERSLLLAAAVFVDLMYFEKKAGD